MAWNHCVHGWAAAHLGQTAEGLAELESGIDASKKIMGEIAMPHFISMLAEVLILRCDYTRALDEVHADPEAQRNEPRSVFQRRAVSARRRVPARPWRRGRRRSQPGSRDRHRPRPGSHQARVRAAAAMAMLWAGRSEQGRARALLQAACSQLRDTENTADVRRARSLLAELA